MWSQKDLVKSGIIDPENKCDTEGIKEMIRKQPGYYFISQSPYFTLHILPCPVQSYPIRTSSVLYCSTPSYPVLLYSILPYPTLPYPTLPCPALNHPHLLSPILFNFILLQAERQKRFVERESKGLKHRLAVNKADVDR
jgi:hypothetical protein